ncbi:MAG: radical SAM protein, partial [Candidatus Omnitrophica bacterium]|nr:radical SAM protein [Candidatus Omnitrophota bacterium]
MKKNDYAIIPFNSKPVKDRVLVSSHLGHWALLTGQEFRELGTFKLNRGSSLFKKLHENGLVIDCSNISKVLDDFRKMNVNLFRDTSLHIAVVTTKCNLECGYCQAKAKEEDMGYDVAAQVLKYIFGVSNPLVTLEFQGGEPLLNWKTLTFLVRHVRKINKDKDLKIALVSNLTLLDNEKMGFLAKNGVELCGSLDGPKKVHDSNRRFKSGKGTYDIVIKNIRVYERKFGKKIALLPTITSNSFPYYEQIIDEYVRLGQAVITLRPLNRMG